MKKLALMTLVALLSVTSTAFGAGIFPLRDIDGNNHVYYFGNVEWGDADKLAVVLDENPDAKTVIMVSSGGIASEASRIGQVLSDFEMTAHVPEGYYCLSACATAFLGAAEYDIDGALGFHNAWAPYPNRNLDHNDYLGQGQALGVADSYYYLANGFSMELPFLVSHLTSPNEFLTFFDESQLEFFLARTEEDKIDNYLTFKVDLDEAWIDRHILVPRQIFAFLGG